MYRFIRTATIRNAAQFPSALAFASQVTAHVNKRYSLDMRFGVEQFGCPRVHWHFDADSLDSMQQVNSGLMEDREYAAMLEKYKDIWVEGSLRDTIIRLG